MLAKIGLRESKVPTSSKIRRVASLNQIASMAPIMFSRIVSIWPNWQKNECREVPVLDLRQGQIILTYFKKNQKNKSLSVKWWVKCYNLVALVNASNSISNYVDRPVLRWEFYCLAQVIS